MGDKQGLLSKHYELYDEEEGISRRSFMLIDDKCICREVIVSSLSVDVIVENIVDVVNHYKTLKLNDVHTENKPGLLDKLWRTSIKLPESPRRSLVRGSRSASRTKSPEKSRSLSSFGSKKSRSESSTADQIAETVIGLVKTCMSLFYSESELPPLSAGEIKMEKGRVSGMWKLCKGGMSKITCSDNSASVSFPVSMRGLTSSYDFSGRRLKGELSCTYEKVTFQVQLSQQVSTECYSSVIELENLALIDIKGARLQVSGFGPLNWFAGKSVTNIIQETSIKKAEDHLRAGIVLAIQNGSLYFQCKESEVGLVPAGVLVC